MPDLTSTRAVLPAQAGAPGATTPGAHVPVTPVRRALRRVLPALAAYAAVRALGVLCIVGWALAHHIAPITRLGTLWDAGWYARVADHGYALGDGLIGAHGIPYSPRAFFPLYPWLGHLASQLTGLGTAGGLVLVAWASSLCAAGGIFAVADRLLGARVGLIAVVLWGVLPLAAVESYGYSESLFTALSAWSLYAVLRRRWLTAGLLCLAAGLTRPSATALIAAVVVAAAVELRRDSARQGQGRWQGRWQWRWRPAAAAVLAPLGWLGYLAWTARALGSPMAYFHIQAAWDTGIDGGWSTLRWYGHEATKLFAFGHEAQRHALGRLPMALTGLAYLALLISALRRFRDSGRGAGEPGVGERGVGERGVGERGVGRPGVGEPGAGEPGAGEPGVGDPGRTVLGLGALGAARRQVLPVLVFGAGLFLVDFVNSSPQPPIARFLLPAFPLLLPAAQWLADRPRLARPFLIAAAIGSACYGVALTFHGGAPS